MFSVSAANDVGVNERGVLQVLGIFHQDNKLVRTLSSDNQERNAAPSQGTVGLELLLAT